ncbi:MAG: ATPase domain-containing protein [Dehalococcoidia bacterium]
MKSGVKEKRIINTGNDDLDKKMGGGIPLKSLTLIEGQPDAGKSVLCQQMIWGSLKSGLNVAAFTTENTVRSLISQMQSLNLDVLDYFLLSRLQIYPLDAKKMNQTLHGGILPMINKCIQWGVDLVIIDSITYYATQSSVDEVISFFQECKGFADRGMSIVCSAHTYAFDEASIGRVGAMCDAHIKLKNETMGSRLVKIMEVAKVRGADMRTGNIISFDVEPGLGIKVIPFSKAKA